MTRQVKDSAERGIGEAPSEPLAQQSGIANTLLPGIRVPVRRGNNIIGHSALFQEEQGILEPA